jgi:hypothetical protein
MVSFDVRTCAYREVLVVQYASKPLLNSNTDVLTLYVLPMEKHELELVTSICTMYCNVTLHNCTRHIFDMASLGPRNYVVVVVHVGGSKASDVKLVLQREPRSGKARFLPVLFCLMKDPSTLPFASCLRKPALP